MTDHTIDKPQQDQNKKTYEKGKEKMENAYQQAKGHYQDAKETGEDMYQQVKDSANQMYEEGKKKVAGAQNKLSDYSENLMDTVREKPLTSLLIAGGMGFILSALLNK